VLCFCFHLPLCCLSFFNLRIRITTFVSLNSFLCLSCNVKINKCQNLPIFPHDVIISLYAIAVPYPYQSIYVNKNIVIDNTYRNKTDLLLKPLFSVYCFVDKF
jgi:hypothetical protein